MVSLKLFSRGSNPMYLRHCSSAATQYLQCLKSTIPCLRKYLNIYTGCPRRNGQNFGRVFLMLKYTDKTQNTYVQSWTVTEIKAREKCGLFVVSRTVPGSCAVIPIRCTLSVLVYSWPKHIPRCDCTCKVLGNPKDNYDVSASVFVVQFNGFMSLTS